MKSSISLYLAAALLAAGVTLNTYSQSSPGEVDFGQFAEPARGGEYVDIQIGREVISLAARLVDKRQPDAARLLRSVRQVRVNVIGLTDENRDEMNKRVQSIRSQLEKLAWQRVVTVQEKNGENVGIYLKTRGDEAVEGIVLTVLDGKKEAVFINIVGDIKPDQVAAVGEALNIDPLKKAGAMIKK